MSPRPRGKCIADEREAELNIYRQKHKTGKIYRPFGIYTPVLNTRIFRRMSTNLSIEMSDCQKDRLNGGQETGASECRARALGLSNHVECLAAMHSCHWRLPFGEGAFCTHPLNLKIAKGLLPTGWSWPAR